MKIKEIIQFLEQWAPPAYQEGYDNSKLITGNKDTDVTGVLTTLDCTEAVVEEAISNGCNLIVAHHPIVFSGMKSITGANYVERTIIKAIKNDTCIYAFHTNLDHVSTGVNAEIAKRMGIQNPKILAPKKDLLSLLILYGTKADVKAMREAVFIAGGGQVGNYSECSFELEGTGSFMPNEQANPTIGSNAERTEHPENKVEFLVPNHLISTCLNAAKSVSSYEEVAHYILPVKNTNQTVGSGMIGELSEEMELQEFLLKVKDVFKAESVRYTNGKSNKVKRIALCGGSGSFLLSNAMAQKADVFLTSDFKYHQFFDSDNQLVIADIGHYEAEQFTKDLITDVLREKFNNFAVHLSQVNTNPVNYI